jgi:hypothetical protein
MASDFMDDTGHQISVEFDNESLSGRVFSFIRQKVTTTK